MCILYGWFSKESTMNIYVGNLSLELSEDELRREFAAFGDVVSVTIMNDKYIGSGQTTGYGFVEMAYTTQGKAAIDNLQGKKLQGRPLQIVEALPLSPDRDKYSAQSITSKRISRRRQR